MAEQEMEVEDYSLKREKKKKRKRKTIDVKIEMVKENPEKIAPLVGYFPTGYNPHSKDQDGDNRDDVKVYRRRARLELVVKPKNSKVNFVGTNYSGEGEAPITCQYALGILDKETQTLKIVKIESNKIFRLEPKFAGKDEISEESKIDPLTKEDTYERMRDLTNAFGTKKANKQIKVRDSLNRKEDADTVKETQKKMTELKVNPVATPSDGSEPARNIPHHDILAETPEKAYPLDRIISKQEMDILKYDLEGTLLTDGRVSPDAYPVFVCNRVQKLKEIKDEAERQTLGVILLYMTHLIKFRDQQSIDHRASARSHRVPEILYKKFSNKFLDEDSGKKKREASGPKNDLLVSHVLVLSLMADEYKSDQTDIARDLRMTMLKLRPHYLNLGCKMVGGGKGKIAQATLPVPLKFPPLEQRRRKKKRV